MRSLVIGPLLSIAALGCAGSPRAASAGPPPALPAELWQHWVHSFEEDTATYRAYRPEDYAFPPARGRDGFELRENGEYIRYDIARGDGTTAVRGSWKQIGPDAVEVRVGAKETEVLRILSCKEGVLKLHRPPGS